jgi:hypothetical protein
MICYQDRTWCTQSTCSRTADCDRYASLSVRKYAHAEGIPLCVYTEPPACYLSEEVALKWKERYKKA